LIDQAADFDAPAAEAEPEVEVVDVALDDVDGAADAVVAL
jgi:hypothetical protein